MSAYPVKWFKHDMPNAPVLTGEPGMLIGLLDACLLNGWGLVSVDSLTYDNVADEATLTVAGGHGFIVDQVILISGANEAEFNGEQRVTWIDSTTAKFKPVHTPSVATAGGTVTAKVAPVGDWAKPFSSGDNLKAIYQSSSPDRLSSAGLRIDDSNTASGWDYGGISTQAVAYETFSDLDTVSNAINSSTYEQFIRKVNSTSATYLASPQEWVIVADDRLVYLFINQASHSYSDWYDSYVFGEVISYKQNDEHNYFIQLGYTAGSSGRSVTNMATLNSFSYRKFQRGYSGLAGPVSAKYCGILLNTSNALMGKANLAAFPNPVDNGLYLTDKVYLVEGSAAHDGVARGELPGFGYPLHDAPLSMNTLQAPWRGNLKKLLPIIMPSSIGNSAPSNGLAQCLIDIEGPWRA